MIRSMKKIIEIEVGQLCHFAGMGWCSVISTKEHWRVFVESNA